MVTAKNYDELCVLAVEKVIDTAMKAVKDRGCCRIALSGGETPKGVYALMASRAYKPRIDWSKTQFFLVDERWVPQESPRSNYGMMIAAGLPAETLRPVRTDAPTIAAAVQFYQQEIINEFHLSKGHYPKFDLMLLGVGEDGHTASLFAGHPVLKDNENFVAAVNYAGVPEERITMTLPVLNHAQSIVFLVSGSKKAAVFKDIFEGRARHLPAALVHASKETWWLVDQAAASPLQ